MSRLNHNRPYLKLIDNLTRESGVHRSRANSHSGSVSKWKKVQKNLKIPSIASIHREINNLVITSEEEKLLINLLDSLNQLQDLYGEKLMRIMKKGRKESKIQDDIDKVELNINQQIQIIIIQGMVKKLQEETSNLPKMVELLHLLFVANGRAIIGDLFGNLLEEASEEAFAKLESILIPGNSEK